MEITIGFHRELQQECIPLECVPSALYHMGGSRSRGFLLFEHGGISVQGDLCQGDPPPPVDRQDPCEIITLP